MFNVRKTRPGELVCPVSDQGVLVVGTDIEQCEGLDTVVRGPASFEVRGPVDPVVVRAREGKFGVEKLFDGRRSSFS